MPTIKVKGKTKQAKARIKVKAAHTGNRKDEPAVEKEREVVLAHEGMEPCSMVGVSLGYRISENYQSVHMDVHVSVPVAPGQERQGLEYARREADRFLAESGDDIREALEGLAE